MYFFEVFMNNREFFLFCLLPLFFLLILATFYSLTIPDRYPNSHDLEHGCVAIELDGFPYKLCPLNP